MKDGGPAFPAFSVSEYREDGYGGTFSITERGMSLRDWFAGQALAGYMVTDPDVLPELAAKMVYAIADAMLAEREGR